MRAAVAVLVIRLRERAVLAVVVMRARHRLTALLMLAAVAAQIEMVEQRAQVDQE
jgi:hypothetical protein